ncbi:hypothetical protein SAMN05443637_112163 [Pseudonocardia thermophila]|jgi:hypothetical protein|uniref:DUF6802 domain-containing protein n=1 Tax=Pseudonocardia thermophila TaxID=1848 RepID=A0A1M6VJ53_PSETH|nr:DUF6802 family protein [Pseudonocardia thermophila]SHK81577.1 hypothetical protein SAMN05443637_112163 [Pseudonocardia thermophila]
MPELRPDPPRRPWDVPDEPVRIPETGLDTDGDGVADTVVRDDGADLLIITDLDADGVADQVLRLTGTGEVRMIELLDTRPETTGPALDLD